MPSKCTTKQFKKMRRHASRHFCNFLIVKKYARQGKYMMQNNVSKLMRVKVFTRYKLCMQLSLLACIVYFRKFTHFFSINYTFRSIQIFTVRFRVFYTTKLIRPFYYNCTIHTIYMDLNTSPLFQVRGLLVRIPECLIELILFALGLNTQIKSRTHS